MPAAQHTPTHNHATDSVRSCSPSRTVSLPVSGTTGSRAPIRSSRMGKWRALVLILIHVAIAAHIVQWLVSGMQTGERRTVSPVEPSESMYTLELGEVNAGFVFFVAAILSTLLFGRWFCGWGCHVVALQDLCAWLMHKCGIHPKPWRSRLLMWFPLVLALYMFVWPAFRRWALEPLADQWWGGLPAWIGRTAPLHGFTNEFIVEDFWKTFAPWHVAIPFLLVCGFAIVYMLGSKAFCNYGCPYGGFFMPVDRLSPLRIRVNDDCNQCGHCTAVCSSNVRVSEEVRDYGMVVDPSCFKCMDCVSVCPNDALSVGLGKPAILAKLRVAPAVHAQAKSKRDIRFDLSLGEEIAIALAFLVLWRGFRGMPLMGEAMPLLMAAGVAAITAFMLHKCWRLLRDLNVRAPRMQLKIGGSVTTRGWCFALATLLLCVTGLQGAGVWLLTTIGEERSAELDKLRDSKGVLIAPAQAQVYAPGYEAHPLVKAQAARGLAALRLVKPITEGGAAFYRTWDAEVRSAWLHAASGDLASAEQSIRHALAIQPTDDVVIGLARVMRLRAGGGKAFASDDATLDAVEQLFTDALRRKPELFSTRFEFASLLAGRGKADAAATLYADAVAKEPGNVRLVRDGSTVAVNLGRPDAAIEMTRKGLAARPKSAALLADLASLLLMSQPPSASKTEEARLHVDAAIKLQPDDPAVVGRIAECLGAMNRLRDGIPLAERCLSKHPRDIGAIRNAAGLHVLAGSKDRALAIMREGVAKVPASALLRVELAGLLQQMGFAAEATTELKAVIAAEPTDPQVWNLVWQLTSPGAMNLPETHTLARQRLQAMGYEPVQNP